MKEFGWSIEYTLSLTFPVFFDLYSLIRRIRLDAAVDEFYTPYGAAKFGGKCSDNLFNGRGSIMLSDEKEDCQTAKPVTRYQIRKAVKKAQEIAKAQQEKMAAEAEKSVL